MSDKVKSAFLDPAILGYVQQHARPAHPVLKEVEESNASHPLARMQIPFEQGGLMQLLVRAVQAKRAIEVGVFTGYSSICIASALPDDGLLVACDISDEYTQIARQHWQKANLEHKIDLRIAPAGDTLQQMIDDGQSGTFDFAFIDANKNDYDVYFEQCLQLLRPGGMLVFDNMLRWGDVIRPEVNDNMVKTIRAVNTKLSKDPRVLSSLIPMADGLHVAIKI